MSLSSSAVLDRIAAFPPASAQLVGARDLLTRIDSKYVVSTARLDALLGALANHYGALEVPGGNLASYQSLYFDTPTLRCFHDHRRGRRPRHKIRIRHYPDRRLTFLELKTKRRPGVTEKHRRPLDYGAIDLGTDERAFLRGHIGDLADELVPTLEIRYRRLGLLGITSNERLTIDLALEAVGADEVARALAGIAIVEVKQATLSARTPIMQRLHAAHVRARSFSKYAVAMALAHPELPHHRLRPDLRAVTRMNTHD